MSRKRSRVPRHRPGTPVSSVRLKAANHVLDQLEPLHHDDPEIDRMLQEANRIAVQAAREKFLEWIGAGS